MDKGWIKLHRKILDWEWFDDATILHLFLLLLLKANFENKKWRGQIIKRGSFVTSLENLSNDTNLSIQQLRTRLHKLQSTKNIVVKSTNKFTLITICNYESYQNQINDEQQTNNKQITNEQQTNNKQITNEQQTNNKQITTTKELKNEKELKNLYKEREKNSDFVDFEIVENKEETNLSKIDNFGGWGAEIEELTQFCSQKGYKKAIATSPATRKAFKDLLKRGEDKEDIKMAIDFAVNDSFWRGVFTSPAMLTNEDKADQNILLYDKLILKLSNNQNNQNNGKNKQGITPGGVANIIAKYGLT